MKYGIIIVALSLFLAACAGEGTETGTGTTTPFLGGNNGVVMDFLPEEPPSTLQDNGKEQFTITVEATNDGEDEIKKEEIEFKLKGVPASDLGSPDSNRDITNDDFLLSPDEDLEAKLKNPDTGNVIASPPVYVTFGPFNYDRDLAGNIEKKFFVEACYVYETYATADLCIKEDLQDTEDTEVCTISGSKQIVSSGAPVQVSNFLEFGRGTDAVGFSFTINEVGSGFLSKMDLGCSDIRQDEGQVYVEVDTGMSGTDCSVLIGGDANSGYIKVTEGGREVNCKQPVRESDKHDEVLTVDIHLVYDYAQTVSKTVLVKSFE